MLREGRRASAPFDRMFPLVEVSFSTAMNRGLGGQTIGTIQPGIIWAGPVFPIGAEAIIPGSRLTGHGYGGVVQFHFYLDDLFPRSSAGRSQVVSDAPGSSGRARLPARSQSAPRRRRGACLSRPCESRRWAAGVGPAPGVRLFFSDRTSNRARFRGVTATNRSGTSGVDLGNAQIPQGSPAELPVGLKPLAPGTYMVTWHVVSVDTHPTEGSFYLRDQAVILGTGSRSWLRR